MHMNRIKNLMAFAIVAVASVAFTAASANAVITGVVVHDFSSQLDASFNRRASMTVDGSGGVPVNSFTGSHSGGGADGTHHVAQFGDLLW